LPAISPHTLRLSAADRTVLESLARAATGPYRHVLRAKIVLTAADGTPNTLIAARLNVHVDTVRKWRRRFCEEGMDGLADRPCSGRPRRFAAAVVAQVKALACELPATSGIALAKWSCPEPAREAIGRGIVKAISASTSAGGRPTTRSSLGSTAPGSPP
jgi:transposase-like protein